MVIDGVIFDFHGTLVDGGDPDRWVASALRHLAESGKTAPELTGSEFKSLSDHLDHIWQHAHTIDPNSDRDLDHARHHDVFTRTVALHPGVEPELIEALYAVMPDQWFPFDDTLPVLKELKARGTKVVVLSNIGLDIRPHLTRTGILDLVDDVILSFEVGLVKPDPAIFAHALELLGVPGDRTLMVGDSARDDVGGAALSIRTLILPRTEGPLHGLDSVLHLVGATNNNATDGAHQGISLR
ncbi:FMN phosphatase YigB (HAD superfamily) [Actinoplanes lutulentus]|uniref:HAD superfamily hydrolase (TIGR01509 family)/HAD superfamily hydrolase (TIGR01549 family) n=1 Tax=Actinoplanes lutulentus TaxID=1287878 RepID=A0A327ZGK8_9ACTN|nr:HAD family hydrolase [Actinoplanes lutulentus]MBB2947400.1 FMN phosphatase YigB (HAD superfamily) [Actinoplanes lutulentus]RAK36674.1 HAD superfamily hydrolase (TIGR01509 family)/HAD superfamily hydrolase (TIGR01549 family) [Actinoplanes lutulentus]